MTAPTLTADETETDEAQPPADFARPVLERQMARLERLADLGMELAEGLKARAAEPQADPAQVMLAYSRVARAVRMTCALQTEVIEQLRRVKGFEIAAARGAPLNIADLAVERARRDRKTRIAGALSDIVDREHAADHGSEAHERHVREVSERLKDADDLGDILARPFEEIIAQICKDLGLNQKTSVHPDGSRDPGFFSPQADRTDPEPVEAAPLTVPTSETQNTWVPTSVGMNPEDVEAPPEPESPPPYTPPCLEDIYAAASRGPPALGLPGELPPLRPDGRPAPYRPPPCNYTHGFD